MTWYQCSACGNSINCTRRDDPIAMKKVKEQGHCPDYNYKPHLRFRSTFR